MWPLGWALINYVKRENYKENFDDGKNFLCLLKYEIILFHKKQKVKSEGIVWQNDCKINHVIQMKCFVNYNIMF